jgi:hypothetical protein
MTARACAKDLIKTYVLRGDSIVSLACGCMGSYSDRYHAQIGGYIFNKFGKDGETKRKLTNHQIGIERIGDEEILAVFSLEEIYREILDEQEHGVQVSLGL